MSDPSQPIAITAEQAAPAHQAVQLPGSLCQPHARPAEAVGDRTAGDSVSYPDDDLMATLVGGAWQFAHKDGTPY